MRYLYVPAVASHRARTPDVAQIDVLGDIDIRLCAALLDWTPSSGFVFAKWDGGNLAYGLQVRNTGTLRINTSANGVATAVMDDSTAAQTFMDGSRHWIRTTLDVDNGAGGYDLKYYTGGTDPNNPAWTQFGTTIVGGSTTSIANVGAALIVGGSGFNTMPGNYYRAQIYNGINGTLVADFNACDFAVGDTNGATAIDSVGLTWTLNGAGVEIRDDGVGYCLGEEPAARVIRSPRYGLTRLARR